MSSEITVFLVGKQMDVIGGIQAVNRALQRGLVSNGTACQIFSFRGVPKQTKQGRILDLVSDLRRFWHTSRRPENVFVFNVTGIEIVFFSVICVLLRRKFFYWLHGSPRVFQKNLSAKILIRYFFKRAGAAVVLHNAFVSEFKKSLAHVIAIPNVVDQLRSGDNLNCRKISRVVWVGRLSEEKNPDFACEAMHQLALLFPSVQFSFISPGSAKHDFSAKPILENFRFVDGTSFAPDNFFDSRTLHLLTSKLEAMPGVLFESTSRQARFVSTKCSPWVDDLTALGHGISVPVDICISDFVEKVGKVLTEELLDFHTERIRAFLAGYNEESVVAMWREVLEAR
jgi:glycosyltransferase involved in cell wall biosynthesis